MTQSLLRLPAVRARTGLSRSNIYRKISLNEFPKPVPLGARAVGWIESDIDRWVEQQIELGRKESA